MRRRPYVVLSLALSLDGRLAPGRGPPVRLGSGADLERLRVLRRWADTLIVGANTLRAIDPPMSVPGAAPRVVVVSRRGHLSPRVRAFVGAPGAPCPWLVTRDALPQRSRLRLRQADETLVHKQLRQPDGGIASQAILAALGRAGAERIVVEGGGRLATAFLRSDCIDELVLTYAPMVLGGTHHGVTSEVSFSFADAPRFWLHHLSRTGHEIYVRWRRRQS